MEILRKSLKTNKNTLFSILLLIGVAFSFITIVKATAPDPGHNFSETSGGVAQGDILYGSAVDTISVLAKNTSSTRYLSNTGTSNNPAWAQIDLTNGVTGILPGANGGTGNGFFAVSGPATSTKTFTFPNASSTVLTSNDLVTIAQGGTGSAPASDDQVLVSDSTTAATWKTINDCQGTGKALTYTQSSNTWGCNTITGSSFPTATLAAEVTTTSATVYSTVFTYTPPASKNIFLNFYLIARSDTAGNAVQFRVRSADTGNVGNCSINIPTAAAAATFDLIAIAAAPADDGGTAWLNTGRTPVAIRCSFVSDGTPGDVILEMQGEIAGTNYYVYPGSYYVVNTD